MATSSNDWFAATMLLSLSNLRSVNQNKTACSNPLPCAPCDGPTQCQQQFATTRRDAAIVIDNVHVPIAMYPGTRPTAPCVLAEEKDTLSASMATTSTAWRMPVWQPHPSWPYQTVPTQKDAAAAPGIFSNSPPTNHDHYHGHSNYYYRAPLSQSGSSSSSSIINKPKPKLPSRRPARLVTGIGAGAWVMVAKKGSDEYGMVARVIRGGNGYYWLDSKPPVCKRSCDLTLCSYPSISVGTADNAGWCSSSSS